jgi:transcriptional regulator with XRE-family HTH domain
VTETKQRGMRLKEFSSTMKLKQCALAQRLGVTAGFLSQVINGREDVTGKLVLNLSQSFPLLNMNWLLHGDGPMFLSDEQKKYEEEPVPDQRVSEAIAEYVSGDPLGSLRRMLEEYERRLRVLEAEVARLKEGNKTDGI